MNVRMHRLAVAAAFVVAGTASGTSHAVEWITPGPGNWSVAGNWSGAVVPTGGASTSLVFGRPAPTLVASWTVTNDLGGNFAINTLEFAGNTSAGLTLRNASGAGLAFTGAGAHIDVTGAGAHTLSNQTGGLGITLNDNLAINMGPGELIITAPVGGSGALVVNGSEAGYLMGRLTLSASNTFSGGLTLNSGNLILSGVNASATPAGTGTLTINGGILSSASTLTRIGTPVQLNADLRVNTGTLTINGPITVGNGSAGLRNEGGSLTLNTALATRGATVIGATSNFYSAIGPATLTLGGNTTTQGTLLDTAALTIAAAGTLVLDNTSAATGNLADRVNDAAAVNLQGGVISLRAAAAGSSETLGATRAAGYSIIEVRGGTAGAGALTLATLERAERGVLLVRGQNLGNNAVANHGNLFVSGTAPALVGAGGSAGSTTLSIVPWMVGNYSTTSSTGNVNSFVTYDAATGVRPLNTATEFATTLGANAADNVRLAAATVNNATVSVNALALDTASLSGTGTINVTSGAVLFSGSGTATYTNNLAFGAAEGVFTTNSTVNLSGNLSGSNGFTKAGQNSLVLSGDNTGLTGPLTISGYNGSASRIDISAAQNLPGTGAITVYSPNTTAAAGVGVNGIVSVARDFVVRSGAVALNTLNATSEATFTGNISGEGGVIVNASSSWGLVRLTGNNTYTGPTRLNAGYLQISSDAQLGNGGALLMATNVASQGLELAGNWTTSRPVQTLYQSGLNTAGYNAVLNGPLSGGADLYKIGDGALVINGGGNYSGKLYIYDGALFVNSVTAANVWFDGTVMGGNGRVGDVNFLGQFIVGAGAHAAGTFSAGSMVMLLGSSVEFDLGQDLIAIDTAFTRDDQGFGSKVTFNFSGAQLGHSYELVHFGSTTFAAADFAYTGLADGLAGSFAVNGSSLSFSVTAVPEPGSYALLLAGLGAVAAVVRRRQGARA